MPANASAAMAVVSTELSLMFEGSASLYHSKNQLWGVSEPEKNHASNIVA